MGKMTEEEKQEVLHGGQEGIFRANQGAFAHALDMEMQQFYKDRVVDQLRMENSPLIKAMCKDAQDRWDALPWYKKRSKRFQGWVYWTRRSVGEWIAGEKFNNDY